MGSRLHGNDGRRRAHPTIVIPTTAGIHGPTIVIPATAGIHGGGPAMGSRLHGNDGPATGAPHNRLSRDGRPRPHNRHSRDGANPRRGAGDGFPSPRERRAATAHPNIVIPVGNPRRRAGDGFPSPRKRRAGGGTPHNRHSRDGGNPRRGAGDGFPSPRERRAATGAPHNRHSRDDARAGDGFPSPRERRATTGASIVIPATTRGPAMGSRLHGNDGPAAAHTHNRHSRHAGDGAPKSSFPRRRESTAGDRRWVPVSTGTTGGDGALHNRRDGRKSTAPQSSFPPRRGAGGDGFPSPRERRAAAAHPKGRGGQLASSLIEWRRSGAAR